MMTEDKPDSALWGRAIDKKDLYRPEKGHGGGFGIRKRPAQKLFGMRVTSSSLERAGKMILAGEPPTVAAKAACMDLVTLLRFCDEAGLPLPDYYRKETWGHPKPKWERTAKPTPQCCPLCGSTLTAR